MYSLLAGLCLAKCLQTFMLNLLVANGGDNSFDFFKVLMTAAASLKHLLPSCISKESELSTLLMCDELYSYMQLLSSYLIL